MGHLWPPLPSDTGGTLQCCFCCVSSTDPIRTSKPEGSIPLTSPQILFIPLGCFRAKATKSHLHRELFPPTLNFPVVYIIGVIYEQKAGGSKTHPLPHPAHAGKGTRVPNPRPGASNPPTAATRKPAVSWKQAPGAISGSMSVSQAPQTQQLLPAANTLLSTTYSTAAQPARG